MTNAEQWLPIDGHPGYEVSDLGRVRRGNRILAQSKDRQGYSRVSFWTEKGARKVSVHTLVAPAFLGPRPDGQQIRHIHGLNAGNGVNNLCYGTQVENEADKDAHGTKVKGTRHHSSKISEADVIAIRARYKPRDLQNSLAAIGKDYGLSNKTVQAIVKRETWKHIP